MRTRIMTLLLANLVAIIVLSYVLDVFGIVNYYSLMQRYLFSSMPFVPQKKRLQDTYLLEKEEIAKMRMIFLEREKDLKAKETQLIEKEKDIVSREDSLNDGKKQLAVAWQSYTNKQKTDLTYVAITKDLAVKWKEMPPEKTVLIIQEHAKNGEDQLILDVLLEMDKQAAAEGAQSITSYLLSLLPADLSARLLEKYRARAQS
ncbi:MAG: flagellar protein FlbB [Spirochaetes bacterium]|nr:flagellar protein FlbB [Spirochaetota bacterium]